MKRNTADRVRPILLAMERSIDAARRRRLDQPEAQARPLVARPGDYSIGAAAPQSEAATRRPDLERTIGQSSDPQSPIRPATTPDDRDDKNDGQQRLKARPKRPAGFLSMTPPSRHPQVG